MVAQIRMRTFQASPKRATGRTRERPFIPERANRSVTAVARAAQRSQLLCKGSHLWNRTILPAEAGCTGRGVGTILSVREAFCSCDNIKSNETTRDATASRCRSVRSRDTPVEPMIRSMPIARTRSRNWGPYELSRSRIRHRGAAPQGTPR